MAEDLLEGLESERRRRKWEESRHSQQHGGVEGRLSSSGGEGDTAGARRMERGDCVLFCGHHSFTHGIRGQGWAVRS